MTKTKVLERIGTVIVHQVPPTVRAARTGTATATGAIGRLSDSTLGWLAASSIGLGAGLYLSGRRRLTVAAGLTPALVAAVASMGSRRVARPLGRSRSGDPQVELPPAEV
jgi:hypothetical protein